MSSRKNKIMSVDENNFQSLHNSVQQETEKILRWKTQTEMGIQEKERILDLNQGLTEVQSRQISELEGEKIELQQQVREVQEVQEELAQKVLYTKREIEALSLQIEHLHFNLKEMRDFDKQAKMKSQAQGNSFHELLVKFKNLNLFHDEKMTEVRSQIGLLEEERERFNRSSERKISALLSSLSAAAAKVEKIETGLNQTGTELTEHQALLASRTRAILNLILELEMNRQDQTIQQDALAAETEDLRLKCGRLNTHLADLNASICGLKTRLNSRRQEISQLKSSIGDIKQELEILVTAIQEKESEKSRLSLRTRVLDKGLVELQEDNRLMQEKKEELERLKIEFNSIKAKCSASEEKGKSLKGELSCLNRMKREKLDLNTQVLDLEKQIYAVTESFRSKIESEERNFNKLKSNLEEKKREEMEHGSACKDEIVAYQAKLKTSLDSVQVQISKVEEVAAMLSSLKKEKEMVIGKLNTSRADLKSAEEKGNSLREELELIRSKAETALEDKTTEISLLEQSFSNQSNSLQEESEKMENIVRLTGSMNEQIRARDQSIQLLKDKILQRKQEIQSAELDLEQKKEALIERTIVEEKLLNQRSQLETDRTSIAAQVDNLNNDIRMEESNKPQVESTDYESELARLRAELESVDGQVDGVERALQLQEKQLEERNLYLGQIMAKNKEYRAEVQLGFLQMDADRKMCLQSLKEGNLEFTTRLGLAEDRINQYQEKERVLKGENVNIQQEKEEALEKRRNLLQKIKELELDEAIKKDEDVRREEERKKIEARATDLTPSQTKRQVTDGSQGGSGVRTNSGLTKDVVASKTPVKTPSIPQTPSKHLAVSHATPKNSVHSTPIPGSQPNPRSATVSQTTPPDKQSTLSKANRHSAPSAFGRTPNNQTRPKTRLSEGTIRKVRYEEESDNDVDENIPQTEESASKSGTKRFVIPPRPSPLKKMAKPSPSAVKLSWPKASQGSGNSSKYSNSDPFGFLSSGDESGN